MKNIVFVVASEKAKSNGLLRGEPIDYKFQTVTPTFYDLS